MIVAWQSASFPASSTTVMVTTVAPRPRTVPAGGAWLTTRLADDVQLSVATICGVRSGRIAAQVPSAASVALAAHVVITGSCVSWIVNTWSQVTVFPHASVERYVRVRMAGLLPPITSPSCVTVGVPQLSVLVTRLTSAAGTFATHWTDVPAGQEIVGGVLSSTVKTCTQLALLPQSSVTV